ncbi:MAG: nucleotidyltransferase domain-containing protein [Caldilineaceae bacterium]
MVNRLALADRFIQAQLAKRPDIIAAWVGGSTVRGEATESSDIDVAFVIPGESGQSFGARDGVDGWHDGIYYDAGYLSAREFADLETVMQNPFWATNMNYALLRYDPTGHFTRLQEAVRTVYMEPAWLAKRLNYWLDIARINVAGLQEAMTTADFLRLAEHARWAAFAFASLPLLRAGITPSSSRCLIQLGTVAPELQAQIYAFVGASTLSADDVLTLEPWLHEWIALVDRTKHGYLLDYFVHKAVWLAGHGYPQMGFTCMFALSAGIGEDCRQDAAKAAQAIALAQRWQAAIHWTGEAVLQEKAAQAQSLLHAMETLATDLPAST